MDLAIQTPGPGRPAWARPAIVSLTGTCRNLLRMWAELARPASRFSTPILAIDLTPEQRTRARTDDRAGRPVATAIDLAAEQRARRAADDQAEVVPPGQQLLR